MRTAVYFLQTFSINRGVNRCGVEVGMPKHFLNTAQVRATVDQVGGKGVTQEMGRHCDGNATLDTQPAQTLVNGVATEGPAPLTQKQVTR